MMERLRWMAMALISIGAAAAQSAWAQSAPSPYTSATRYDGMGRVTGTIAPDPDDAGTLKYLARRTTYNASGQPIKVETGELASWQSEAVVPASWAGFTVLAAVETTYDAYGRKATDATKGSDGIATGLTQYSYDARGRLECTAVRMNPAVYGALPASACTLGAQGSHGPDRITKNIYDAAGQVLQIRRAVGSPIEIADVTYSYTANGKVQYVIDANGNKAEKRYDAYDRNTRWVFPSTTRPSAFNKSTPVTALASAGTLNESDYEAYTYDANGNRLSLRKRDGSVLDYTYDNLNRMTIKTVPERASLATTHTRDVFFGYDLRGLMTSARFDSAAGEGLTTSYDGFGRITSTTQSLNSTPRTLAYCYDPNGNRTRMAFPGASTNGCVAGNWTGNVAYTYDELNRPAAILRENGATIASYAYRPDGLRSTFGGGIATSYDYDPAGRLNSLTNNLAASAYNNTWTFGYNPASQITSTARSNDQFAWTAHVNVDRPYITNGLNQYTQAGAAAFCHDANGNLTADGTSVYIYDVENRLVEKRAQGTGNTNCAALSYTGTLQTALRYDPMGRLYEVTSTTGAITRFLNDGDALVAEYGGAGTLLRRYVHGTDAKADDPIAWYEGAAFTGAVERIMRPNWQGSIVIVADSSGANVLAVNRYDEYGIPQSTNAGRFQYTGQAWIAELGVYYYKARMYSATLGRFLQTDPIGYKDQINLYAYVSNDPVNLVDYDGQEAGCVTLNIGCGLSQGTGSWESIKSFVSTVVDFIPVIGDIKGGVEAVQNPTPANVIGAVVGLAPGLGDAAGKVIKNAPDVARSFQTYTKTNPSTGQVYSGRTSGTGTPRENVARREGSHQVLNKQGYGPAQLDRTSGNAQAIRGREQQLIERNGGAQSQGGTSANQINGISNRNPQGTTCRTKATAEFGPC